MECLGNRDMAIRGRGKVPDLKECRFFWRKTGHKYTRKDERVILAVKERKQHNGLSNRAAA